MKFLKLFISILYFPLILPSLIAYILASGNVKVKVNEDIAFQWKRRVGSKDRNNFYKLYHLLQSAKEFRNVYYCRFGRIGKILKIFLHEEPTLFINPVLCKNYAGGLYIAHGTSSQIYANKIGRNLWMHHNVTLGMIGEGRPEIGDNVYIGTGAVVLGGVKIGNNVKIGANAIVIDDVPDNAVVVSPKAKVVKIYDNSINGGG